MRLHPALARRIFFNRRNFLICLPLAACAKWQAPGAALPLLPPPPAGPYRLGPGDELTIRIYGQPDLSGPYSIDDSGYIDMPLLGLIAAAKQSNASLASTIANALKAQKLILHPSVAVEISRYRPFYILGEVNTPGPYPFRPGMTDLTAISIAGGFTYRAEQGYVGVTRVIGSTAAQYRAPLFALAQPGDVITVFERYY
jgi:polysaccharide export outer membrane protein